MNEKKFIPLIAANQDNSEKRYQNALATAESLGRCGYIDSLIWLDENLSNDQIEVVNSVLVYVALGMFDEPK